MIKKNILAAVVCACLLIPGGIFKSAMISADEFCPLDSLKPRKVKSLDSLKRVPVLHQGRIKPFETYSKNILLQFSGREHYQKESACEWMARFLFAPRTTSDDKIFIVNHPEILEALKIGPQKNRRYSFRQLDSGFEKLKVLVDVSQGIAEKNQSIVDKELIRVYENLLLYIRLSGAFGFAIPHPDFTFPNNEIVNELQLPPHPGRSYSFFDILEKSEKLRQLAQSLDKKDQTNWSTEEKNAANIISTLLFWTDHYADCPLGIIPTKDQANEEWMSPMDTIIDNFFDPVYHDEVENLRDMTLNYWDGSQLEFDLAVRAFTDSVLKYASAKEQKAIGKIPLELFYNRLNLFLWAKFFYAVGFMLFLCSLLFEQNRMYRPALMATVLGFCPHLLAMMLRILIMSRPPVSNLFETFIFVGVISVVLGFILEAVNKNWLGLVVSNSCGLILLLIAGKFSTEGDTMQMLVAVLNSNFWLSTHVLAITTGYAGCCVAGIMGHIYILQALSNSVETKNRLEITHNNMLGILGFGLTMAFLGTTLGGIWADQSWGRFWGWDPKENGALMIVLWAAIVFHARIAKIVNPLGVAVGCILALMNVVWAWFGVNLLSVGLHSYGFTSGIANTLIAYFLMEVLFISISVFILGQKKIKF